MNQPKFLRLLKSLPLAAALLLMGCGTCRITALEPGIYTVTYIEQTTGQETTTTVTSSISGVVVLDFCARVINVSFVELPESPEGPPPNMAPVCSQAIPSIDTLTHDPASFVDVSILGVTDPEGSAITFRIDSIRQDEPTGGLFPGDVSPDSTITTHPFELRAERDPAGDGRVYTIEFTADDSGSRSCAGVVKVCAPVEAGGSCIEGSTQFGSHSDPIIDITAVMTDSPDPANVGDNLTYTVTATNASTLIARNIQVLWIVPLEVSLVSIPDYCNGPLSGLRTLGCVIDVINPGDSVSNSIIVAPESLGQITMNAEVRPFPLATDYSDPNPANSTPSATTTIAPPEGADLAVTVSDSQDPVQIGFQLIYTIVVTNNGPQPATGVTLTDTLGFVEFNLPTPSQGSCSYALPALTCNLGTIASGASVTLTLPTSTFATGTLANTATVTAIEFDPDASNNNAVQNTTVLPRGEAGNAHELQPRRMQR